MRTESPKSHFIHYLSHGLNIMDKLLTLVALRLGFVELNPIVNIFVFNVGVWLGILLAGVLGFYALENLYLKKHDRLLKLVAGVYLFVVCSNLTKLLIYYGRYWYGY